MGPWLVMMEAQALTGRVPLPQGVLRDPGGPAQLTVKLVDGLTEHDGQLQSIIREHDLSFTPLVTLPEPRITALQRRAQDRTQTQSADLRSMMEVMVPSGDLMAAGEALGSHPSVEYVHIAPLQVPPPGDIAPKTPDFSDTQTYWGSDPGLDFEYAWGVGATGEGVWIADCEYGWQLTHEDLVDQPISTEPDQTVVANVATLEWDDHGTAVLGVMSAGDNNYGMTGVTPDALVSTYPEWTEEEGNRRVAAIAAAIADAEPGDIVLLEMQVDGNTGYGPAELDPNVFVLVQTATAAGVVVVAPAGNGNQDLDDLYYGDHYLKWGDSGAILVGAGSADVHHDQLWFSTYGARVDVQGWGENVATLGYGDLADLDEDGNQAYTLAFLGTSSAAPMVAGACAAIQDFARSHWGSPLSPAVLRSLLVETGTPQGKGEHIGPLPDLKAALQALDQDGDGFLNEVYGGDDCHDDEATAYPGAPEIWYDDIDNACDGGDDFDQDGDGSPIPEDCSDLDPSIHPDADDPSYDGIDSNCDGTSDYDADGDGFDAQEYGGDDCDDGDPQVGACVPKSECGCSASPLPSWGLGLFALMMVRRCRIAVGGQGPTKR